MAKALTSEKILLGDFNNPVRLSFLSIDKPKSFEEGKPGKYQATGLLDPTNAAHAKTLAKVKEEALKLVKAGGLNPKEVVLCLKSGDDKTYDGYAGMKYIPTGNDAKPAIADRSGIVIQPGHPQWPYSGCYGVISITLWLQNNKYGKKVNANLRAIRFVKDGDAFGVAPVDPDEEFSALGDVPAGEFETAGGDDDFLAE
jgi:hypothetical protein